MTTAVYFDLDGTLLTYAESFDALFARTVGTVSPETTADGTTQEMADRYTEAVLAALEDSRDRPYERAFAAVVEEFDVDADPSALADEYVDRETAATRLADPVADLVAAVADHHPTGILTNGDGRMQRRKIETHGLDDVVDEVVVSGDLEVRKPDPQIFETAKRRLPADTHVYVGDTPDEDVGPAAACGFHTVHVESDEFGAATGGATADLSAPDTDRLAAVVLALLPDTGR